MGLLRARLALIGGQRTPATLLIAGAGRSEGTSTVARGLAEAYARHGTQTLLVECDVASPRQAGRLGLDDGPGLAELLAGAATSAQVTSHVALEGGSKLAVICAGHCGQEGAQLLDSSAMRSLLEQLAERYELVLLDAPAFDATPEALALVEHADGVVVVGRLGGGRVQASREFAQLLASSQAHVLGVIANAVKRRRPIALDAPGEWASHAATGKLTADTATPVPVTPGEA
jgi:Mrp family chromosome partitioning ATPase